MKKIILLGLIAILVSGCNSATLGNALRDSEGYRERQEQARYERWKRYNPPAPTGRYKYPVRRDIPKCSYTSRTNNCGGVIPK